MQVYCAVRYLRGGVILADVQIGVSRGQQSHRGRPLWQSQAVDESGSTTQIGIGQSPEVEALKVSQLLLYMGESYSMYVLSICNCKSTQYQCLAMELVCSC